MKKSDHLPVYGVGPVCVYSMVAFLIVGILLWHYGILASGEVIRAKMILRVVGIVMIAAGVYMWIKAVVISKVGDAILENRLITTGIYAWVRNPIYSAAAIALTGIGFLFYNLWFFILPVIFWLDITLIMKYTEEKWLLNLYGDEYKTYCTKVNRCIPWFPKAKTE